MMFSHNIDAMESVMISFS